MSLMMRGYTGGFAAKQAAGVDLRSLPEAGDIFPGEYDGISVPSELLIQALATYKLGIEAEAAVAASTKLRVVGNAKNRYWSGRSQADVRKALRKALDAVADHDHVAGMFWYCFQRQVSSVPERSRLCRFDDEVVVAWPKR